MSGSSTLVVVDVQNDFCHPEGAAAVRGDDLSTVQAAVDQICAAIDWARTVAMPVIFVRVAHSPWFDTPEWTARSESRGYRNPVPMAVEGAWGAQFYRVSPAPEDLVITKIRYSAFQYTPLEVALRGKGSAFYLAGTQTDVCIDATALDGLQRGFAATVITDCVATPQKAAGEEAIERLRYRGVRTQELAELQIGRS